MESPGQDSASTQASKPRRTSAFLRLMTIHWWMARLFGVMFVTGWAMVRWPRGWDWQGQLYDLHKSLGVLAIILLLWRIVVLLQVWWRKYTKRTPAFTLAWGRKVALHTLLYGFMVGVPLSGVLYSNSIRAGNVRFFGLPVPDLFPADSARIDLASNLHVWLAYTFAGFIGLHIFAQRKVVRAHWRQLRHWVQRKLT